MKTDAKELTIANLQPGQRARVTKVCGRDVIRQRLMDMGLMPDTLIKVERKAPVGDPIWISLQCGQISLRRKESESVFVTLGSCAGHAQS